MWCSVIYRYASYILIQKIGKIDVLSFFPLDVLDEIWDLIESVSEGFLTYSYNIFDICSCMYTYMDICQIHGISTTEAMLYSFSRDSNAEKERNRSFLSLVVITGSRELPK